MSPANAVLASRRLHSSSVAAMITWSAPGQPVGNPGGLAHSVAVLLEVVDREVLALRRVRKSSVAELLDDWHELVLGEAVECLSGLPEVDHAPAPVDRASRVNKQTVGPAEWTAGVHGVVHGLVLLLRSAGELESYPDCHVCPPLGGFGRAY